jgi:secondary thiamine-phosphate synthase enzyme
LTLFAGALITGGVGPWLPFQMFAAAWVGLFAGMLPEARGRAELSLLAGYGVVAGLAYGALLNLWFWPFAAYSPEVSYVAGDSIADNLHRYALFWATTSLGWDIPRGVLTAGAILLVGGPVLAALRRTARRASFLCRLGEDVGMETETRTYRTGDDEVVRDLTRDCAEFSSGRGDGLLHLFVPHATAGLAILETGSGSDDDLLAALGDLLPADDRWRHRHGSRGHGRSHVMPALIPPYATIPVVDGDLQLGTWQSICLVDLNVDNSERSVRFSFLPG